MSRMSHVTTKIGAYTSLLFSAEDDYDTPESHISSMSRDFEAPRKGYQITKK